MTPPIYAILIASAALAGPQAAQAATARSGEPPLAASTLRTTVQFSFDIDGLRTDHQFDGQINSFHVTYEYGGPLQSSPAGELHAVPASAYPYFESIRNDMTAFILSYRPAGDFYEVMGDRIGRYVLDRYPQLKWIEIVIRVPAFGPVGNDRTATVRVARGV